MESVIYEIRDKIAYVDHQPPPRRSMPATKPTYDRLGEVWRDFRDNDDAWVAIMTGMGERAFCAGSDIKENFNEEVPMAEAFDHSRQMDLIAGAWKIWKPIIAGQLTGTATAGAWSTPWAAISG